MLKLIKYLKKHIPGIIAVFVLLFIQAMADLALPDYMSNIVNNGIAVKDTDYIFRVGGQMLLVALIGAIATVAVGFLAARIGAMVSMNLREDVFKKVESFSLTEFDTFGTSSLITRTTNDVQQVQMFIVMALRIVFYAPIVGVGGIFRAVSKSSSMSYIIAVAVVALLSLILVMFSISLPKFKAVQKMVDKLNHVTRDSLVGMLVIRAFNTQKYEEERFDKANKDLTKLNLFVNRLMSLMMPAMMLIMNITSISVIWVGSYLVDADKLMVGDMMAFMQYAMQIIMSFLMVSMAFIMMPRASVSAVRISEVLTTEPVIKDPINSSQKQEHDKGTIEFKDVSFKYPGADEYVLEHISFTAKPAQTTAFIGSTGSGKSTLINLIPRFYDVSEGEILIDGINIKELSQHKLRDKIGYIPQKGVLFSGTIASNLRFGDEDATLEQLEKAAEISQSKEFISQKEEGFDTPISQGGTNVSGGQKQRLSIARALVKKPEIYIFDDSFSALDFKTDATLRKALKSETGDSTVLIVAQRISTIINAEQIIVLDEGKVAGIGTHKELMQNCSVYKEIALSQLSEEELA